MVDFTQSEQQQRRSGAAEVDANVCANVNADLYKQHWRGSAAADVDMNFNSNAESNFDATGAGGNEMVQKSV